MPQEICEEYGEIHLEERVVAFVDNDSKKWGTYYLLKGKRIPIISVANLQEQILKTDIILITSRYFAYIYEQLEQIEALTEINCYIWPDIAPQYKTDDQLTEKIIAHSEKENQIPKKIHYFWFGDNEIPPFEQACIDSWKRFCPEYDIICWDETNYDITKNRYMQQAYEAKKWGFVPDYARLDIIYQYGGIYLDTDVQVIQSFDLLLKLKGFAGFESKNLVAPGLGFGACAGHDMVRRMRDGYDNLTFKKEDGTYNLTASPYIQTEMLKTYGLKLNNKIQEVNGMLILPSECLSPDNNMIPHITRNTFSVHNYAGSWTSGENRSFLQKTRNFKNRKTKKILHMTPPDINNGVYRYIFNHMQYIDQTKYQFAFLTKGASELRQTPEYKKYRFDVYELKNTQRESAGALREEIVKILKEGFDAIHLHTSSWRGFLIEEIAMEMGIEKVIVHSHSTGIDVFDNEERENYLKLHNGFKQKFSMAFATNVCACSRMAADWLFGDQIPKEKIQILPNAIDVEKYSYNAEKRHVMRKKMGVENRIVFGCIGRYTFQKNHSFLLRVFAEAKKKNSELYLLCIGEGELLEELKESARKLGISSDVSLLDWQMNIEEYLQAMDVFCLPSRFEGLPISVIEAQAAGLPCLISNTITKEVQITELVTFLPLKEELWVKKLQNTGICNKKRKKRDEMIASYGYDIKAAVKKLMELYD